eukprot:357069-Chlamydomonas_euryale.AAC.6
MPSGITVHHTAVTPAHSLVRPDTRRGAAAMPSSVLGGWRRLPRRLRVMRAVFLSDSLSSALVCWLRAGFLIDANGCQLKWTMDTGDASS